MSDFVRDLAVVAAITIAIGATFGWRTETGRIDRLQARVSCLERPHGESSIAAKRVGGHFVVTAGPTRTGCAR